MNLRGSGAFISIRLNWLKFFFKTVFHIKKIVYIAMGVEVYFLH